MLSGTLHTLTIFHTPQTIIVPMLLMRKLELMNKSKSICPRSPSLEDAEPELARSCMTMAGHLPLAHMVEGLCPLPSKSHRHLPKGCTPRRQSWCLLFSGSGLWNFKPPTLDFIGSYWRPAAQATFPPKMGNLLFPPKFPVLVLDGKMYFFPLWPLCICSPSN